MNGATVEREGKFPRGTTKLVWCSECHAEASTLINIGKSETPEPWQPDFDWLTDRIAVGGCFPMERAAELAEKHGIEAIVDLRGESCDDDAVLRQHGLDFLHLPTPDMEPASAAMLSEGVAFVRGHLDRGHRVLIHCQHGIGRSALLALCVMVDQGFKPLDAIAQAKDRRERVSPSPSQFEGWCQWLQANGHQPPDMHSFGCIAYRHLGRG